MPKLINGRWLDVTIAKGMGMTNEQETTINIFHIKQFALSAGKTKITFIDGQTIEVKESPGWIKAYLADVMIEGGTDAGEQEKAAS